MKWIEQIVAVTGVNIRSIGQRWGSSAVAIVGIAGVVAVFVGVLSIAAGFQRTMTSGGSPGTALIMRSGADSELTSILTRDSANIIANAPGIERVAEGPLASAELFLMSALPKRTTGTDANVVLRGVHPIAFQLRPELHIVEGRRFEPGRNEIIAGRAAARQFGGLEVGNVLKWGENSWTVVGLFESDGSLSESEIWCDVGVAQPAYRRGSSYQVVFAKLTSPDAFTAFKDALTTDPRLDVQVQRESDYYAEHTKVMTLIINRLGFAIAGLMGVGAIFGALNTMYNAVATRTREIATLRALGFGAGPVVISVMAESLMLALIGGLIGGSLAYLAFNGYQTATMNWQSFSQVAFAFAVTPTLLTQGVVYALIMGLVGGILPAIRAARLPIVTALREL